MNPMKLYFEDVSVGDASPEIHVGEITRTMIVRYAGASGDFNPIHHDEVFATEAGLPSIFAMGMMNAGFVAHLLQDWMGLGNVRKYSVKFKERVWPGDQLKGKGTVVSKAQPGNMVKVELTLVNQHDKVALQADALVALPSRNPSQNR